MLAPLPSTNRYVPHGFFKIESFTVQSSPGSQENSVASTERASYSLVTVWEVCCPTVAGEKLMLAPCSLQMDTASLLLQRVSLQRYASLLLQRVSLQRYSSSNDNELSSCSLPCNSTRLSQIARTPREKLNANCVRGYRYADPVPNKISL